MQEGRDGLKKELLNAKEPELGNWENSEVIYITKNEKACFEEKPSDVVKQPLDR